MLSLRKPDGDVVVVVAFGWGLLDDEREREVAGSLQPGRKISLGGPVSHGGPDVFVEISPSTAEHPTVLLGACISDWHLLPDNAHFFLLLVIRLFLGGGSPGSAVSRRGEICASRDTLVFWKAGTPRSGIVWGGPCYIHSCHMSGPSTWSHTLGVWRWSTAWRDLQVGMGPGLVHRQLVGCCHHRVWQQEEQRLEMDPRLLNWPPRGCHR